MYAKLQKAAPISCKVTLLLVGNGVNHCSYRYNFSLVCFDLVGLKDTRQIVWAIWHR
jgi:hypothetical protein